MILATVNLYVALMPPIKLGLNSHFSLRGDVFWRISRRPSWMLEWNKFSSSEPSCLPNASHQVSALSELPFESRSMSFQDFQAGQHGSHLRYWNKTNLAILNLHVTPMPPTKFGLNLTFWEQIRLEDFQDGHHGTHLGYLNGIILAILNLYDAAHPIIALSDLRFGRRCRLKTFKMSDMAAILGIGKEWF